MYIINPDRIWREPWRFFTYGFVHNDGRHLAYNLISQFAIGFPLELANGWKRIAIIYVSGIILGALGREITGHTQKPMAGASGKMKSYDSKLFSCD